MQTAPHSRPTVPASRRLLYSALTVLLLLGGLELGLGSLGLGRARPSISRGFDPTAAYILPVAESGHWKGWFTTQMYGDSSTGNEVMIPPKSEKLRLLLFGGSNTAGFPDEALEQGLNRTRAAGTPEFEVINLGRVGYGSARIVILYEQALELLDPDLTLFYEGHNEFVERSFEQDVQSVWSNPVEAQLADWAGQLRSYRLLAQALEPDQQQLAVAASKRGTPEEWKLEFDKFKDFRYEQTLEQLEKFRANVSYLRDLSQKQGVGLLISTAIYNDLTPPYVFSVQAGLEPDRAG